MQVPEIHDKFKETNMERYGVKYPSQNSEIKETNMERYGVENVMFQKSHNDH